MTDLTPGSRWLLPVRFSHSTPWQDRAILTVMPYGGNSSVVIPVEDPTSLIPADRITELEGEVARLKCQYDKEHHARLDLQNLAADEVDVANILANLLSEARFFVIDALEAHEHTDGRDLLNRIDAALNPAPSEKEAG